MVNISGNQLFAICNTLREFMEERSLPFEALDFLRVRIPEQRSDDTLSFHLDVPPVFDKLYS